MNAPSKKPSKKEIEIVRTYWRELDSYRPHKEEPICEDLLVDSAPMALRIISNLGDGDPKEAARKHAMAMIKFHEPAGDDDMVH